jgi:predicted Zn-dependent peptidase
VTVSAGTSPEKADELSTVIAAQVGEVAAQGITAEELEIARDGFEGSILLGLEGTGSRMARLGSSQSLLGRVLALDEYVSLLREITLDDVNAVLAELLTTAATTARVGPGS